MPLIFEGLFSCQRVVFHVKCCLIPNSNFNMNAQYLYYDEISQEWEETSLENLAVMNEPDLKLCIYTTYSELEKTQSSGNTTHANTPPVPPTNDEKVLQLAKFSKSVASIILKWLIVLIYMVFSMLVYNLFYYSFSPILGFVFLIGALIFPLIIYIVTSIFIKKIKK